MRAYPNCQHVDNYRNCRIFHGAGLLAKYLGIRPSCILSRVMPPADGEWTCDEQKPYPRPAPPCGLRPPPARND